MNTHKGLIKPKKTKELCVGCHSDYYNYDNPQKVKECWSFKSAKVIKAFRIGWWTPQDKASNFHPCYTFNCYTDTGRFAYYPELPEHLRNNQAT